MLSFPSGHCAFNKAARQHKTAERCAKFLTSIGKEKVDWGVSACTFNVDLVMLLSRAWRGIHNALLGSIGEKRTRNIVVRRGFIKALFFSEFRSFPLENQHNSVWFSGP